MFAIVDPALVAGEVTRSKLPMVRGLYGLGMIVYRWQHRILPKLFTLVMSESSVRYNSREAILCTQFFFVDVLCYTQVSIIPVACGDYTSHACV